MTEMFNYDDFLFSSLSFLKASSNGIRPLNGNGGGIVGEEPEIVDPFPPSPYPFVQHGTIEADLMYGDEGGNQDGQWRLNDIMSGDAGDDIILGLRGNDTLVGQSGHDTLIGGVGNDVLTGGEGGDVFIYDFGRAAGNDTIMDFSGFDDPNRLPNYSIDLVAINGLDASQRSFGYLLSVADQVGNNVVFNFGGGRSITLYDYAVADLRQNEFIFEYYIL